MSQEGEESGSVTSEAEERDWKDEDVEGRLFGGKIRSLSWLERHEGVGIDNCINTQKIASTAIFERSRTR